MTRWIGVVLLAFVAWAAAADEDYWEVGYFSDERAAVRQAERISGAAGVEVWLMPSGGDQGYRLLVKAFEAEADRERLALQLRSAGVEDPQPFAFDGDISELRAIFSVVGASTEEMIGRAPQPEPPPSATTGVSDDVSGYLVVAGSFTDPTRADVHRQELSSKFDDAGVISSEVDGKHLYRVVVGPVRDGRLDDVVESLVEEGVQDPWVLRYTGDAVKAPGTFRKPPTVVRKQRRDLTPDRQATPESGYNPARLRRDVVPFPEDP